jgi:ubiquinone/menaquinone biosynthesis C-methylase UbiE
MTGRVGWYTAFYVMGRHIVGPMTPPGEVPPASRSSAPSLPAMRRSLFDLFEEDWADIERGLYRLPKEFRALPDPLRLLSDARTYLREAMAVTRRANTRGGGTEVRSIAPESTPVYYRQNFHFQSDGWFTEESATVYDTQVEVLFTGSAAAMRRRALALIAEEVRRRQDEGQDESDLRLADLGCGTGPLLADVADNFPAMHFIAADLSEPYLRTALKNADAPKLTGIAAPAEKLPLADQSLDIVTTVYLFHELPPKVRREVAKEIARVLRPGGLYVHLDSVQYGDTDMDLLLETFPRAFHEPYYESYCREDLSALMGEAGLSIEAQKTGFLSKATAFRKG